MTSAPLSKTSFFALALSLTLGACGADTGSASGPGGAGAASGTGAAGAANGKGAAGAANGTGFGIEFPDKIDGAGGANGGTGDPDNCGKLIATVRDFSDKHPDFEEDKYNKGLTKGLVKPILDGDKKPEYAHDKPTLITSQETFSQWYRDVDGVNKAFKVELPLTADANNPGRFVYENNSFFPLNDKGFGNENRDKNFHFTTEIRGGFTYKGGEAFTFKGDDDVWVFVNGKLALDLGGVHGVEQATIDFDAKADELGIVKGKNYTFDVFHAERHTGASNFRMETSIECLTVTVL